MLHDLALGIIIGLLFISLVVLFCILVVKLYLSKIKTYTRQLYQKDLDFQKQLNQAIIESQEHALNNIAQDLHDDAGQQLTYINFQLENLKLDSPQLHEQLHPLSLSLGELSQSIRGISHALSNQSLLQQDVFKAIATETARLQKNKKIAISLRTDQGTPTGFTVNEKIIIYRIFQEIINNAFKHAKAKHIDIVLLTQPQFSMAISDDGVGFDPQDVMLEKHTLGLQGLKARAQLIGFGLRIESKGGAGTTVTLTQNNTN